MKKFISLCLALLITISLSACGGNDDVIKVGILQPIEHDALSAAREGFVKGLSDNGYDDSKVEITYLNALNSDTDLKSMASELIRTSDIVLGIGTGAAQTLQSEASSVNSDIPIMFTAVTDPVEAGLVESASKSGGNLAGTTDMNPVEQQIQLVKEILPDAKDLGIIYTASEQNSEIQANLAKVEAEAEGLNVTIKTITSASEIQLTLRDLCSEVDAIFIPTDNTLAAAMPTVSAVCNEEKVLTVVGEPNLVNNGGCITLGIDYAALGELTGKMAAEVLDGSNISDMALGSLSLDECTLAVNEESFNAIGVSIPSNLDK